MNPMDMEEWKNLYPETEKKGISLHFSNVHEYVRLSIICFIKWLREEVVFPVHVNVYCRYGEKVPCMNGRFAHGKFWFRYNDRNTHPRIYIGCGDFKKDDPVTEHLMDETDLILGTLMHEIIHYFQFINGMDMDRRGIEQQATYYEKDMMQYFFEMCELDDE